MNRYEHAEENTDNSTNKTRIDESKGQYEYANTNIAFHEMNYRFKCPETHISKIIKNEEKSKYDICPCNY